MIPYKDFVPQRLRKQGFIKPPLYETFQQAVTAAAAWIREQEVTMINIETVVLPALWDKDVLQTEAASFNRIHSTGQKAYTEQFQFVRVWYHGVGVAGLLPLLLVRRDIARLSRLEEGQG